MKYDYLIVGCGPFGATLARKCLDNKKTVLIIDKRPHIGGNAYTEKINNIHVHKYGAHIFHTSNDKIWHFVNQFARFNKYKHKVIANYHGKLYSLPFNMWTFHQFWGVTSPEEALDIIEKQKFYSKPQNLEEQAISMVGIDIYNTLIKHYTSKQWNTDPKNLPTSIIKRLPIRLTYDTDYFDDTYQGIPENGYTDMIFNMVDGATIELSNDFFEKRDYWENIAKHIIYTGPIDKFFDYEYGHLGYRSLFFEEISVKKNNFQGTSVVNYTDSFSSYTRILEHKYFDPNNKSEQTIITKEYPIDYSSSNDPYYPINDSINNEIYTKYKKLLNKISNKFIFGGRLAEYKYYDMHQAIGSALSIDIV